MGGMNVSKLLVSFEGPAKPEVLLTTCRDGSIDCTYRTNVEGEYTVNIQFDEEHVVGSPLKVSVQGELIIDTSKVKVTGSNLKEGRNRQLNTVIIDPREAKITSKCRYVIRNVMSIAAIILVSEILNECIFAIYQSIRVDYNNYIATYNSQVSD